ncbi:hypothetical protein [Caulobacter segnis]|uniref:Uncharacterized protein n=2 Tax=Caulobacter segnis TaxID=88688 RepID=D5VFG7_CAUST|nr:hypothetical protein [Caulobacter segnis]ADG09699.1 conserved hypothetical protein [Caulobacter segnis ATCC 21756]
MLAGATFALVGCATTPRLVSGETWPELEPLLMVSLGRHAVTIRIESRGCADRANMVFRVDRQDGRAVVAFARRRLETCKGPRGWADMTFSYEELGLKRGERIVIANPVISPSA